MGHVGLLGTGMSIYDDLSGPGLEAHSRWVGSTVEPVLGDLWFGRPLVLGDHNHWHGSFVTIKYLA